jgi:hypothetical protein
MILLAILALSGTVQEGGTVGDEALKKEFETIWAEVRKGFEEYRLDDVKKHLDIPPGAPVPNRAQAKEFAAQLPDLATWTFLKIARDGDRAGYCARQNPGGKGATLLILRFQKAGAAWKLAPAPDTLSIDSTDETLTPAQVLKRFETEANLKLRPADAGEAPAPAPAAPAGEKVDDRPEAVIRKDLEGVWKKIRESFAAGKPEAAAGLLVLEDPAKLPSADEAKSAAKDHLPDLVRGQFIKLGWRADKPQLVGYYGQVDVSNAKQSTIVLIVFMRKDGEWKFAPGPGSLTVVKVPHASRAAILKLIETDPRLKL